MTENPITVQAADPIKVVWDLVEEHRLRRFPVLEGDKLVGIVTDRDLRNATASSVVLTEKKYHDFLLNTVKVGSIMTPEPRTVSPDEDLLKAAEAILELRVGGLPVVSDGKLVGILTETDLVETLIELLPR
jgi:acetoin utilization protein AcuB